MTKVAVLYRPTSETNTDKASLCPYQWPVRRSCDKVDYIIVIHATWHTSHEQPQSTIRRPSQRSHQGRQNSGSHSLTLGQIQIHRDLSIFAPARAEEKGSVSLSADSHIYWNNKPQVSICTSLPLLTVIFMFTPLSFNRTESHARERRWISCRGDEKRQGPAALQRAFRRVELQSDPGTNMVKHHHHMTVFPPY